VKEVEKEENSNTTKTHTTTTRYHADGTVDCSWWDEMEYVKIKVR